MLELSNGWKLVLAPNGDTWIFDADGKKMEWEDMPHGADARK